MFPTTRMRRLRRSDPLRRLTRETRISMDDVALPLFVSDDIDEPRPIASLPGHFHWPPEALAEEARRLAALGVPAILLFGVTRRKDRDATEAYNPESAVCRAVRAVKGACLSMAVITDVCLCEYTDHGHCGVVRNNRDGLPDVDNDATLDLLARTALAHAEAGADLVAPSDMMDGRVGHIRRALDAAGHSEAGILAYSAKYASAFYGPFREAAGSTPQFGDRKSYQMDPANRREALREIALDIDEGADMVMVKPALPYLDIIREAADRFDTPIAAYQVSGEYAMVKAAAAQGWADEQRAALETLTAIKRAGADLILTYWAADLPGWLD
jgi:porphobilinogen synthase